MEPDSASVLPCPLCGHAESSAYLRDRRRSYLHCARCKLVFVPPAEFVSEEAEKAEYELHRNSPDDPGYRRFLSRLADPLLARLAPGSAGLDFGSGPGPTLSVMLEEAGHCVALYDPFYAPGTPVFDRRYDFITATEVVEHLHRPGYELARLWGCLKPGGWLGVMTQLVIDREAFARWRYKEDATHVVFFSKATFRWLAADWGAELTFADRGVMLLRKPSVEGGP